MLLNIHVPRRDSEDYEAMYKTICCGALAGPSGISSDVTSQASSTPTPTSREPRFEDILEDPEYDQISDREQLEEDLLCFIGDPRAIRTRAMAADFSEGRLETLVGSPQKELAGTQNQYVSYQVTTKVRTRGL